MQPTQECKGSILPASSQAFSEAATPTLVAVLLNPPTTSTGARTRNAVARAAKILDHEHVVIANLCSAATPSVVELNTVGPAGWDVARSELLSALKGASAILAAWGISGLTGKAGQLREAQVRWLSLRAQERGITRFWMVGQEPRHPSRWHQYVSNKYGRTSGGSFESRLREVLMPVQIQAGDADRSSANEIRQAHA